MKHLLSIILALTIAISLITSCEVILPIDNQPDAITVNSVVCPDTAVLVNVSRTFSIDNSPGYYFIDYYHYYRYHDTIYDTLAVIDKALVMMTVNGGSPVQQSRQIPL